MVSSKTAQVWQVHKGKKKKNKRTKERKTLGNKIIRKVVGFEFLQAMQRTQHERVREIG